MAGFLLPHSGRGLPGAGPRLGAGRRAGAGLLTGLSFLLLPLPKPLCYAVEADPLEGASFHPQSGLVLRVFLRSTPWVSQRGCRTRSRILQPLVQGLIRGPILRCQEELANKDLRAPCRAPSHSAAGAKPGTSQGKTWV